MSEPLDASSASAPQLPSRWQRLGLSCLSAVCMVLACPTFNIWWLGFVAWVPMLIAIEGARPKAALFYGWVVGFITVFWGFFWMTDLMTRFAMFPLAAAAAVAALFAAYQGLLWGFAALLIVVVQQRSTAPIWLIAPLGWVVAEALMPSIFPVYMALAWCWHPLWIQTAELGGPTAVSGIMVAINAGIMAVLMAASRRELDRRALVWTIALLVTVPLYGSIRIRQVRDQMDAVPHLRVGVVQGNMSIRDLGLNRAKVLREQRDVSAELEAQGAQIILWGETAYPYSGTFRRDAKREPPIQHPRGVHTKDFTVPALIGAVTRDLEQSRFPWNTALLLDASGQIVGQYDKVFLLIFGEYIPFIDPQWYMDHVPGASYLNFGEGPKALTIAIDDNGQQRDVRVGPIICYEDILPRYVRQVTTHNVHLLLNLTNDAWFGRTAEPAQHLGLSVFRAVEHRKALVRAVNTGVSAYVDPTGETHHRTKVTDPDVQGPQRAEGFVANVPLMDPNHRTLFGRTGDLFNVLCVFGLGLLWWARRR